MRKKKVQPQVVEVAAEKISEPVPSRTDPSCMLSWKTFGECKKCGMALNSPGSPLRAVHKNDAGEFCALCCVKCREEEPKIEWGF